MQLLIPLVLLAVLFLGLLYKHVMLSKSAAEIHKEYRKKCNDAKSTENSLLATSKKLLATQSEVERLRSTSSLKLPDDNSAGKQQTELEEYKRRLKALEQLYAETKHSLKRAEDEVERLKTAQLEATLKSEDSSKEARMEALEKLREAPKIDMASLFDAGKDVFNDTPAKLLDDGPASSFASESGGAFSTQASLEGKLSTSGLQNAKPSTYV